MSTFYHWEGEDLILSIRTQPRASREKLGDVLDDRIKVYLTAAPVDGKANKALCKFLGQLFKTPPSTIEILSGKTDRNKRLRIPSPRKLPSAILPDNHSANPQT
jgi:uncharacterized protein (TIGR00251 family)